MTFTEILATIQGFLGTEVVLTVSPLGGPPLVGARGVLERGHAAPHRAKLEAAGVADPGDEGIMLRVEPGVQLTVWGSKVRDAGIRDDPPGALWIDHDGIVITVCDAEAQRRFAARLPD